MDNYQFELEQQNHYNNTIVEKIVQIMRERISKLDQQEENLGQIVTLKLYSFAHFLRLIDFKGFAKWVTLNITLLELHPNKLSLEQISNMKNRPEGYGPQQDDIYLGLLNHYAEKFMHLTITEANSLTQRANQFKQLLRKAVMVIFLFNNVMNMRRIKESLNVFMLFRQFTDKLIQ